jgi:hypothetical protein
MAAITVSSFLAGDYTGISIRLQGYPELSVDQEVSMDFSNLSLDRRTQALTIYYPDGRGAMAIITDNTISQIDSFNGSSASFATVEELYDEIIAGVESVSPGSGGGGDGNVIGAASSVNNNIVTFNGTGGKTIKDSGVPITAINGTAIAITVAALQVLASPVIGAWYKVTNPAGLSHPLYIQARPDMLFDHQQGFLFINNVDLGIAQPYHPVEYDLTNDAFLSIRIPQFNIRANKRSGLAGGNCIDRVINIIANAVTGSDFYDWNLQSCDVDGYNFDNMDNMFIAYSITILEESSLTAGDTTVSFPYYLYLWPSADVILGDGAQTQWEWYYGGTDPVTSFNSRIEYGDNCDIKNSRYYQGTSIVFPDAYTSDGKELKQNSSSFPISFNVLADTTPDLSTVSKFSPITLSATGATITLSEIQGLENNFETEFLFAVGKVFTFDGAFFKIKGGGAFVNTDEDSFFIGKTNADASEMFERNSGNY